MKEFLCPDAVFPASPSGEFDKNRNQVFSFARTADCLSHDLRPKGFAQPVIKQEVSLVKQA